jgi:hypothetical protein
VAGGGAGGVSPWTVEQQPGRMSCRWWWPVDGGGMTGGRGSVGRWRPSGAPEPCTGDGRGEAVRVAARAGRNYGHEE